MGLIEKIDERQMRRNALYCGAFGQNAPQNAGGSLQQFHTVGCISQPVRID
jgi:hypothetical protein